MCLWKIFKVFAHGCVSSCVGACACVWESLAWRYVDSYALRSVYLGESWGVVRGANGILGRFAAVFSTAPYMVLCVHVCARVLVLLLCVFSHIGIPAHASALAHHTHDRHTVALLVSEMGM